MDLFFTSRFFFGEEPLNALHPFLGTWLDCLMVFLTSLGNSPFYMIVVPFLYWCYDRGLALRIGGAFIVSTLVSESLKEFFLTGRPLPERLLEGIRELNIRYLPHRSPGFPSGHTHNAVVFWGALIWFIRNRYLTAISLLMILLIPYSRIYLGVHFLGDLAGGYFFGALTLFFYALSVRLWEGRNPSLNEKITVMLFLLVPLGLFFLLGGFYIPRILGVLSGFVIGIVIGRERISFNPKNLFRAQLLKLAVGITGIFILRFLFKFIFPDLPIFDFLRYWILGFWITFCAPLIFSRFPALRGDILSPEQPAESTDI